MPGHRQYIVTATLGIDSTGRSAKGARTTRVSAIPNPHGIAAAVERTLKDIRLGERREFILREVTVSTVTPGFDTIAQIARLEMRTAPTLSQTRARGARARKRP